MNNNLFTKSIKFLALDLVGDIVKFPVWWYTTGLRQRWLGFKETLKQGIETTGLSIWFKSLFKPMYGQQDWQGKLISFFLRFFVLLGKLIIFLFWILFSVFIIIFWLVLPLFIIYQVAFNLS